MTLLRTIPFIIKRMESYGTSWRLSQATPKATNLLVELAFFAKINAGLTFLLL